ncbi:D-2-hydroxyacid dehydrogenase [Parashewanella curva]|uniref:D-2-hydroxyacid dehydrogenase n=1 Tax=Parashewanella curva TaxID=2338552 RepID=A0A3L8PVG7_9GAMM|nr:D-2-hydroxyacid dehydrogenase [Parashewanella curva]RLV58428.1 D-2-hydroxyacid dehydrogenase [Parashewanella curva]
MKIVILDYFTLNAGDLDDTSLKALGDITCYDRTSPAQVIERAKDAEVILTNKVVLDATTLAQLPKLKFISVLATGTNVVDIEAAKTNGIAVCNVPAYSTQSVAQMVFAHILNHTQQLAKHDQAVKQGQWQNSDDFCFQLSTTYSLVGKHLGLIGFGETGKQVAAIASAMQMKLLIHSRTKPTKLPENARWVSLEELFSQSDIVSLQCPQTPKTEKLVNANTLNLMKQGALLINCARGGLVDESDLAHALHQGKIYAGVDVLSTEPPAADNPLLSAPNISITPHIAWATLEARQRLLAVTDENIKSYQSGELINQVN